MFIDQIKIFAKAGDGGDGCVSFIREKYLPKGGPDGGDGGRGGDVVFHVSESTDHLKNLFYRPRLVAANGQPGSSKLKTGKNAQDLVIKVPPGTKIYRIDEDIDQKDLKNLKIKDINKVFYADLLENNQKFVLVNGGRGGKGNDRFKSSTNRAPTEFTPGEGGERGFFLVEMQKIADIGLVGYPNAGKSTFLRAISHAKPKTAPYPFTTLTPKVGIHFTSERRKVIVADIPGLIDGAHKNRGLGHKFLRHIMRCSVLVFIVDASGYEGRNPIEDISNLRKEIKLYDEVLAKKPWVIAANKNDVVDENGEGEFEDNFVLLEDKFKRVKSFSISAISGISSKDTRDGNGILELLDYLIEKYLKDTISY